MSPFFSITSLLVAQITISAVTATTGPVSLNFGTKFFGSDGLWSAAQIRVGTPEQYLWVYPSTVSSETWVVGPAGCDGSLVCQAARGGLFTSNQSSSYMTLGRFELGSTRLGLRTGFGDYGLDTIALSDTVKAPVQMLATLTDPEVFLGQVGLNVQQSRFTDRVDHMSLISSLVRNESSIPSHSYGYTAGAQYAAKGVPGSLVLGGVDTTRFTPNNVKFDLASGYIPKVAVTAITVDSSQGQGSLPLPPNWMSNPMTLLQPGQAAQFTIDSSTPFLWMPPAVCDAFAAALNLTYNNALQVYMFPNNTNTTSSPQTLKDWGLTFTFSLANSIDGSSSHVQIPISYNALNLQLSYGFPGFQGKYGDAAVNYFPLRRANSTDQYTLGRAFLQETYLTVEYESNRFSIQSAVFPDTSKVLPNLVALNRPSGSSWPGPPGTGLSTGAKAGIAVAAILIVTAIAVAVFFFIRRRRRAQQGTRQRTFHKWWRSGETPKESEVSVVPVSEMTADRRHPRELLVDSANTRFELPGPAPVEMPADDVPEIYYKTRPFPVESVSPSADQTEGGLGNHSSVRKDYNVRTTVVEQLESPAPPYSPAQVGHSPNPNSPGVSTYDARLSVGFGSHTSSGLAISPITPYGAGSTSNNSPTLTEGRADPTQLSSTDSSSTRSSSQGATPTVPQDMVSRTVNHSARFREDLVDAPPRRTASRGEQRLLRPRYSWERS